MTAITAPRAAPDLPNGLREYELPALGDPTLEAVEDLNASAGAKLSREPAVEDVLFDPIDASALDPSNIGDVCFQAERTTTATASPATPDEVLDWSSAGCPSSLATAAVAEGTPGADAEAASERVEPRWIDLESDEDVGEFDETRVPRSTRDATPALADGDPDATAMAATTHDDAPAVAEVPAGMPHAQAVPIAPDANDGAELRTPDVAGDDAGVGDRHVEGDDDGDRDGDGRGDGDDGFGAAMARPSDDGARFPSAAGVEAFAGAEAGPAIAIAERPRPSPTPSASARGTAAASPLAVRTAELAPATDRSTAAATEQDLQPVLAALEQVQTELASTLAQLHETTTPAPAADVAPALAAMREEMARQGDLLAANVAAVQRLGDQVAGLDEAVQRATVPATATTPVQADAPPRSTAPSAAPPAGPPAAPPTPWLAPLAVAALGATWSVLLWWKTGSTAIAAGVLVGANLIAALHVARHDD